VHLKRDLQHIARPILAGLFSQAEEVLLRIGRAELVAALREVAGRVEESAETLRAEEELFSDAPGTDFVKLHFGRDKSFFFRPTTKGRK
jgi:hypothetical protein